MSEDSRRIDEHNNRDRSKINRPGETAMSTESQWQPIETAPKVGECLVYLPSEHHKQQVMSRNENGVTIIGGTFSFDISRPTHWHPLPAPPQS